MSQVTPYFRCVRRSCVGMDASNVARSVLRVSSQCDKFGCAAKERDSENRNQRAMPAMW